MIRVITIAREYGSGGGAVAARVAERLGWRLLDHDLLREIAKEAGVETEVVERCDERVDSAWYRMLRSVWLSGVEAAAPATTTPDLLDSDEVAQLTRAVIEKAAELGHCVIVGRGGQCILNERQDALHVFIYGPWELKRKRVRRRVPSATDPDGLMQEMDRRRGGYIRRHYGCNWCDRQLYDVMLNSGIGEESLVACVVQMAAPSPEAPVHG